RVVDQVAGDGVEGSQRRLDRDACGWTVKGKADRPGMRKRREGCRNLRGQLREVAFRAGTEIPCLGSCKSKKLSHDARHAVDIVLKLGGSCGGQTVDIRTQN